MHHMAKELTTLGASSESAAAAHSLKGISQFSGMEMQFLGRNFLTVVHWAELVATILIYKIPAIHYRELNRTVFGDSRYVHVPFAFGALSRVCLTGNVGALNLLNVSILLRC